jgi:hypothetical protein
VLGFDREEIGQNLCLAHPASQIFKYVRDSDSGSFDTRLNAAQALIEAGPALVSNRSRRPRDRINRPAQLTMRRLEPVPRAADNYGCITIVLDLNVLRFVGGIDSVNTVPPP